MKNKIMKVVSAVNLFMLMLVTKVNAGSDWEGNVNDLSTDDNAQKIMTGIKDFVKPIAAILVFASVLMVGFEIIMKRNKGDERMASMSSLMWVGIGTLVIAFASLIASFLFTK